MPADDFTYVGHMLDIARKALAKIQGRTRQDFDEDENLRLALAHLLQTVGEAARQVAQSFQAAHPSIPWKAIVGMRHKVVHDYLSVDEDVVWRTVTQELGPLIAELEKLMPPGGER